MKVDIARMIIEGEDLRDFHMHTCYCDGKNTPEEMVFAALDAGMKKVGFSGHSHTDFDPDMCMTLEDTDRYEEEIRTLDMEFGDQIEILCGIEQDYCSEEPTDRWDYVIGSVHYLPSRLSVDDTTQMLEQAIDEDYGGDVYSLCEDYYRLLGDVVRKTGADIVGHFDLVSKFNRGGEEGGKGIYFDEGHPRYVAAWQAAADKLLDTEKPPLFEINFGAVIRGYRTEPYPSKPILEYLKARGAKFILSGDSHTVDNVMKAAEIMKAYSSS
ncbi:MAG: histidinol-phosphatase HisJ family protein [Bacillota bacterium]|nr:histidinol-phosphatase HisJ family protein [Clostridiales bacterium]MDD6978774.1 histidinol-phosphatase HisJ family protein [Bacillota bacterium]MDY5607109.1 histidinol-phosphatase HisJ family protein [Lentihominibacter sp.]MCI7392670.1 histidinol-phosphatase HisJ family protein [Clostridiales bacterium]MDD7130513.1 histidinol-phosphatase HisJ family protein [Bacillota bacterium]